MAFYNDLPDELQPLFQVQEIMLPEAIRRLLNDAWHAMKPSEQRAYRQAIVDRKDELNRAMYASNEAVKTLLKTPRP